MKIFENSLTTNQYTAVKSIHIDSRPKYKGNTFKQDRQNNSINHSKFHIQKKCEIIEPTIIEKVAEISANVENKSRYTLNDLFKKFNNN